MCMRSLSATWMVRVLRMAAEGGSNAIIFWSKFAAPKLVYQC